MLGSKTVGGLLKDPKMASGQRALTAVGRGDPLLERRFNLIEPDSRYVLFFFTSKLLDSCYTVEKKQKYVGLPLRSLFLMFHDQGGIGAALQVRQMSTVVSFKI